MPSEEDLRKADFYNEELSDKISKEGREKLKELKASLDMHIKGVKENELEELGDLNKQKTDALKEAMEKDTDNGPPFGTLEPTPEQRVEQRVNKRLSEIEQRLDKIETFCARIDRYFRDEYKGRSGK